MAETAGMWGALKGQGVRGKWGRRTRVAALVGVVAAIAAVPAGSASGESIRTISAVGGFEFVPNQSFTNTFRFQPGAINVHRGQRIRFVNDTGFGEIHSLTIVRKSELPDTIGEIFNCGAPGTPCELAQGHVDENFNIVDPRLNVGRPGLNTRGDSLAVQPRGTEGSRIRARVTAAKGTDLSYFCAVHPWMQGVIRVR
jgi:plastocyanin